MIIINSNIVLTLINDKCNWKLGRSNPPISTTVKRVESLNAIDMKGSDY